MSNSVYGAVPSAFIPCKASFIAADGTAAKVLLEPQAAAIPVDTNPPSPLYYGGASLIDLTAASTDAANKDFLLYTGEVLTTVGAATGAATTTASTIVRASGSFIADGFKPGDLVMLFVPTTAARQATDGILATITAAAALTLTVNGTPLSALTLTTGVRICRMSQLFRDTVPLNSGNSSTIPAKNVLGSANNSSSITGERKVGQNELIAVAMQAAVAALPAFVSFSGQAARY